MRRRATSPDILTFLGRRGSLWRLREDKADGATPSAARGTRALPKNSDFHLAPRQFVETQGKQSRRRDAVGGTRDARAPQKF